MKLPVFTALGALLSYIAAHFLTLLKIIWLPALLLTGVMAYVMPSMMDAQLQMITLEEAGDSAAAMAALAPIMKNSGLIFVAALLFYPMMMAGVLKHVIRGEAPRLPFYLQFGGDELRVLLAYILIFIISIVVAIAVILGVTVMGVVFGVALGAVSEQAAGLAVLLVMLAAVAAAIWFAMRLSLVFPAAVGARSAGIAESWEKTKGATLGLFFYWLIALILMMVIMTPLGLVMAGGYLSVISEFINAAMADPSAAEQLGEEFERRILEVQAAMWDRSSPSFWMVIAGTWVSLIVQYGFTSVAGGVAWRYLTGGERG